MEKITREQALEKIKELEEFIKGEENQERLKEYFHLSDMGGICMKKDVENIYDNYRYNTLNYFATYEEAEAKRDRDLAIGTVTRAIWEMNGDWKADWSDEQQPKWNIVLEPYGYTPMWAKVSKYALIIPDMKSEEVAKEIIANYKKDLDIIFEV